MFGNKLRSWMEAVRPKKNKHRKDKQGKCISTPFSATTNLQSHTVKFQTPCITHNDANDDEITNKTQFKYYNKHEGNNKSGPSSSSANSQILRYSTTNLSSPESAYSTGYSTDGTSPGAPPDYNLNNTRKIDDGYVESTLDPNRLSSGTILKSPRNSKTANIVAFKGPISSPLPPKCQAIFNKTNESEDIKQLLNGASGPVLYGGMAVDNISIGLMSPRQRNRIRTNPWLPGGTSSAVVSPIPERQDLKLTPILSKNLLFHSPKQHRYINPSTRRRSISSSSGSSESAVSTAFDHHVPRSVSDEEDCTLNEMMGKYDESYVYEKETDILSDSDPTDCESDIDTGQDGGDEDDAGDGELDFIDNGSYLEYDPRSEGNTGHCSYYVSNEVHRRRSSRRRTARKSKDPIDSKRRKSSTSKKVHSKIDRERCCSVHKDGSKSAGATPLSIRRSSLRPSSTLAQNECLMKKRSNSVCLDRDTSNLIDKRDREADIKYRELIGQAEQILRTMNINGLSPRRLPGPANKRVELLRTTECVKADMLLKNRVNEEMPVMAVAKKTPSNNFKTTRFSPKKNHITNFIINNSPVLMRKEFQNQALYPSAKNPFIVDTNVSPSSARKYEHVIQKQSIEPVKITNRHTKTEETHNTVKRGGTIMHHSSPITGKKLFNGQPKSILHKNEHSNNSILSPRHRRVNKVYLASSSSEEEDYRSKSVISRSCPQSEPVRRKIYSGRNTILRGYGYGKTVAFNLNTEENFSYNDSGSTENLRQQVLLSTIQNLKKNLEDQSATLQQTYRSTQNMSQF